MIKFKKFLIFFLSLLLLIYFVDLLIFKGIFYYRFTCILFRNVSSQSFLAKINSCKESTKPPATLKPSLNPRLAPIIKSEGSTRILWTASSYKALDGGVWNEKDAKKMILMPLNVDESAAELSFNGKTCYNVIFKHENFNSKDYLNYFKVTPEYLGINANTIEVIKTNCGIPGFAEYIRLEDSRLVIYINGVFFFLEPHVNY